MLLGLPNWMKGVFRVVETLDLYVAGCGGDAVAVQSDAHDTAHRSWGLTNTFTTHFLYLL